MSGVGFLILFGFNCLLFSCEGAITSPAIGTKYVFLPEKTAKIKWTFNDSKSSVKSRFWSLRRSDGSLIERLASISKNGSIVIKTSLFEVDIKKPSTLVLKNVNQSYNGVYRFFLKTTKKFISDVRVFIAIQPNATITFGPKCELLDAPCIVTCNSSGFPAPSRTINHNSVIVSTTQTYTIDAVKYSDAGIYNCVAKNIAGSDSSSANLTVSAGQLNVTIDCSNSVTVNEGDDFTCVCTNEGGNFPANLTWYKDGEQIGDATFDRENRLSRIGVTKRDSGNYSCEAQRFTVKNKKIVEVKVAFKPRNTTINMEIRTGSNGVSVVTSITCNSDGFPEPNYNITQNGIVIGFGKVTLSVLQPNGIFKCIAWNDLGRDSASKTFSDDKNGNAKYDFVVWHIAVLSLSAFIIGILFSYIVFRAHRRCCGNRKPEQSSEPQTDGVDTNYQDLDL